MSANSVLRAAVRGVSKSLIGYQAQLIADLQVFGAATRRVYVRLARQGIRYWIFAAATLAASIACAPFLEAHTDLFQARWWLFQKISEFTPRVLEPRFTNLVLIRDDAYYNPPLYGTSPTNREYLANLIASLDASHTRVIALDFDLSLSRMGATGKLNDYSEIEPRIPQTTKLMQAIVKAANDGHKIILTYRISYDENSGYSLLPNALQVYGLCVDKPGSPNGDWQNPGSYKVPVSSRAAANIACGYINFARRSGRNDLRLLPPLLPLQDGSTVDAFSYEIARAYSRRLAQPALLSHYFANFIPPGAERPVEVRSSSICPIAETPSGGCKGNPQLENTLELPTVIVGAGWNKTAGAKDDPVDGHDTPIGRIVGAEVHASYVEAILDNRLYRLVPDSIELFFEVFLSLAAAAVFVLASNVSTKLVVFVGLIAGMVLLQWLLLAHGGMVVEALVPITGLLIHSVLERVFGAEAPHAEH